VVFDARGHLTEPHTNCVVPLGTLDVRDYLHSFNSSDNDDVSFEVPNNYPTHGPDNRLGAVLFIEKEGFLDTLPEHARLCQDVLVGDLRRRALRFSVGSTGRVFNAITGLKRELRETVRLAGEPMGSVDLCCAQPALLAVEVLREIPTNGLKDRATYKRTGPDSRCVAYALSPAFVASASGDASLYQALVLGGSLYDFLVERTGLSRNAVKRAVLRDVLAKKGPYPSVVEDVFRRAFPEVYSFIRRVNRNDHAELIRRLQRRESWLVIENVAPRLIGRIPVVTLHDAIFSRAADVCDVLGAFEEAFQTLGFRLSVKAKAVGKASAEAPVAPGE
jgi:hypothetical protein